MRDEDLMEDALTKFQSEAKSKFLKGILEVIEVKDGPRYKMLGNGITAHVMEWIARRISLVTKI